MIQNMRVGVRPIIDTMSITGNSFSFSDNRGYRPDNVGYQQPQNVIISGNTFHNINPDLDSNGNITKFGVAYPPECTDGINCKLR